MTKLTPELIRYMEKEVNDERERAIKPLFAEIDQLKKLIDDLKRIETEKDVKINLLADIIKNAIDYLNARHDDGWVCKARDILMRFTEVMSDLLPGYKCPKCGYHLRLKKQSSIRDAPKDGTAETPDDGHLDLPWFVPSLIEALRDWYEHWTRDELILKIEELENELYPEIDATIVSETPVTITCNRCGIDLSGRKYLIEEVQIDGTTTRNFWCRDCYLKASIREVIPQEDPKIEKGGESR